MVSNRLCIIFLVFLSIQSLSKAHPKTPGPIIEATCWSATSKSYYDLCIHSLRASDEALDSYWDFLPKISVNITLRNITDTHKYLDKLLKINSTDKVLQEPHTSCHNNYIVAIKTIEACFQYFFSYEFGLVNQRLHAAQKEILDCDMGLKKELNKRKGLNSPLVPRNTVSVGLLTIATDLVSLLDPAVPKKPNHPESPPIESPPGNKKN